MLKLLLGNRFYSHNLLNFATFTYMDAVVSVSVCRPRLPELGVTVNVCVSVRLTEPRQQGALLSSKPFSSTWPLHLYHLSPQTRDYISQHASDLYQTLLDSVSHNPHLTRTEYLCLCPTETLSFLYSFLNGSIVL